MRRTRSAFYRSSLTLTALCVWLLPPLCSGWELMLQMFILSYTGGLLSQSKTMFRRVAGVDEMEQARVPFSTFQDLTSAGSIHRVMQWRHIVWTARLRRRDKLLEVFDTSGHITKPFLIQRCCDLCADFVNVMTVSTCKVMFDVKENVTHSQLHSTENFHCPLPRHKVVQSHTTVWHWDSHWCFRRFNHQHCL